MQKSESHERNPCVSDFEEQSLGESSRQADCSEACNLAREYARSRPKIKLRFILSWKEKSSETHECVWIQELQRIILSKGELSSELMDTLRRSKNSMFDLSRPGAVQINE